MYAEACILQANLFNWKRNQIDSNSVLSEIIKTFTKFPYSFSCLSLCHHQSKALFAVLCPLANRTTIYCFYLATEMALSLIYTYSLPASGVWNYDVRINQARTIQWSFSEENSAPIICYRTSYTIQDRARQMERWAEHYSRQNMVPEDALKTSLNAIECLPVLEELDCEPLKRKEALGSLAPWKVHSRGIIKSEILKCYKGDAFTELYLPLGFRKDFWDSYWGRAIQPLVNLFALSPLTVPEVFAKVNSAQFRRDEYNFSFMFYVIYQAWDAVLYHQIKHWEESWK